MGKNSKWGSVLAEVDTDESIPAWKVAEQVGCYPQTVHYWRSMRNRENLGKPCWRCEFPAMENNPILANGRCLWCELEARGFDIYELGRRGVLWRLAEAVKKGQINEPE